MELLIPGIGLLFVGMIFLLTFGLWIIALIDIVRSEFSGQNDKLVWVLIVLFAPFIGAILYFAVGRRNKVNYN